MKNQKKTYKSECWEVLDEKTNFKDYVTRTATKEQRKKFSIGDIFINGAVCKKCGDFIESVNVHDYNCCSCGAVCVDGGSWYIKRMGEDCNYINVIQKFYDI